MRISESQLRRIVRKLLTEQEEKPVPGDAPAQKQLHIFDFDDTLGVTNDSNGVMLYKDGVPAWKSAKDAETWIKSVGIGGDDLLKGPNGSTFEQPYGMEGFAAYVSSGVLPAVKRAVGGNVLIAPDKPTGDSKGDAAVFDFTSSATAKIAEPIKDTVNKLKSVDSSGGSTAIVTARSGESAGATRKNFAGEDVTVSVEKDLSNFMKKQGAPLTKGVYGIDGKNKGEFIKNNLLDPMPDEIHFYDDDSSNIDKVKGTLVGHVPAEVFLYGPGKFQDGDSNPNNPSKSFPVAKDESGTKKESVSRNPVMKRWLRIAGILEK